MKEADFHKATDAERKRHVVRPYEAIPVTELVPGSNSQLIFGSNVLLSFLEMKAGSVFELHSHPEEQIMVVLEGYCDEVIGDAMYRVQKGDVIRLPPNVKHGAFIRDVDCKVIDVFAPSRRDYKDKYQNQHPHAEIHFG